MIFCQFLQILKFSGNFFKIWQILQISLVLMIFCRFFSNFVGFLVHFFCKSGKFCKFHLFLVILAELCKICRNVLVKMNTKTLHVNFRNHSERNGAHSLHKSHELVRSAVRWGHWKHGYVWKLSGLLAVWEKWWSDVWSSRRQLDNWWESVKNTSCSILIFTKFQNKELNRKNH